MFIFGYYWCGISNKDPEDVDIGCLNHNMLSLLKRHHVTSSNQTQHCQMSKNPRDLSPKSYRVELRLSPVILELRSGN